MKHLLVPIGSSKNATNTLQYAIDFAETINAEVFVFRAYNVMTKAGTIINIDEMMLRETNLYLDSIIRSVNLKEVLVKKITAKGDVLSRIAAIDKELGIDLIILGPKSNSIKDEVFLGSTSGSIVKLSTIPALVVPESYKFKPVVNILAAFKSGIIKRKDVLSPLLFFKESYNAAINLLLVKTPDYIEEDLVLDSKLDAIKSSLTVSENATTFQGVLANFSQHNPDMLCVFKRNRGFFQKLWEKNSILKKEFYCDVPLLVLRGLK